MTQNQVISKEKHVKAGALKLEYRLLEANERWNGEEVTLYSIFAGVENTANGEHEEKTVPNITSDKAFAENLFDLIARGKVTPITLTDVISDFID